MPAFTKGFDFRQTVGFAIDPPDCTYVLDTDAYPVTRNGVTFGWTVSPAGSRDRGGWADQRLGGICFGNNVGTFRVDLPGPGTYAIHLALGDGGAAQVDQTLTITDGATTVLSLGPVSGADEFWDATGAGPFYGDAYTGDPIAWPAHESPATVVFAGSTLTLQLGPATSVTAVTYLGITEVSGGGGGGTPPPFLLLFGAPR